MVEDRDRMPGVMSGLGRPTRSGTASSAEADGVWEFRWGGRRGRRGCWLVATAVAGRHGRAALESTKQHSLTLLLWFFTSPFRLQNYRQVAVLARVIV